MEWWHWLVILWGTIALLLLAGLCWVIERGFRNVLAAIADLEAAVERGNGNQPRTSSSHTSWRGAAHIVGRR